MTRVDCNVILSVLKIGQLVQELNRGFRQTSGWFYKLLILKKIKYAPKNGQFYKGVTVVCIC